MTQRRREKASGENPVSKESNLGKVHTSKI
jgi:hypothetical protein